jgi:hypothetical protein
MRKLLLLAALPMVAAAAPSQMLLGIDNKTTFEAARVRNGPGGQDLVAVLDVSDPAHPKVSSQLPLPNSVFGPPTNLQITPDGRLGLVANSMVTAEKDGSFTASPNNTLHVLDLSSQPALRTSERFTSTPATSTVPAPWPMLWRRPSGNWATSLESSPSRATSLIAAAPRS